MEWKDITPAFIDKDKFKPVIINDRVNVIGFIVRFIKNDIINELGITEKFDILICYDEGTQMNNGKIGMITQYNYDDSKDIKILILINNIISFYSDYDLFSFICANIHSLAHEIRHVWQILNNKYTNSRRSNNIGDECYNKNYDNIDFENDANYFADMYIESRKFYIRSIFMRYIDSLLSTSHKDHFIFDIYDFCNYLIYTNYELFSNICNIFCFDLKNMYKYTIIYPMYDINVKIIPYKDTDYLDVYINLHYYSHDINSYNDLLMCVADKLSNLAINMHNILNKDYLDNNTHNNMQIELVIQMISDTLLSYLIDHIY